MVDTLSTLIPAGGLLAVLALLVRIFLQENNAARKRDQDAITEEQERTEKAEARTAEALVREKAAQAEVDAERTLRRRAEAAAALAEADLSIQRTKARWYAGEVDRLRFYLPDEIRPGVLPDPPVKGERGDDGSTT